MGGALSAVPVRGQMLARRIHSRYSGCDRESREASRRPQSCTTNHSPSAVHPNPCLGPRRVGHWGNVELELRYLMGAGAQRSGPMDGPSAESWSSAWVERWTGRRRTLDRGISAVPGAAIFASTKVAAPALNVP